MLIKVLRVSVFQGLLHGAVRFRHLWRRSDRYAHTVIRPGHHHGINCFRQQFGLLIRTNTIAFWTLFLLVLCMIFCDAEIIAQQKYNSNWAIIIHCITLVLIFLYSIYFVYLFFFLIIYLKTNYFYFWLFSSIYLSLL